MRAFVINDFAAPPTLVELPVPPLADNEVRVRIVASSVNGFDLSCVEGRVGWIEHVLPITLGRDYAGVVEEVGDAVTRFAVGDEVYGFVMRPVLHDGTWAEYVVVPEDMYVAAKPTRLDFAAAGALGVAGVAAMQAVEGVDPAADDVVLIIGASGGVGSYALQLAAARGARVIATADAGDEDRLRGLGAAEIVGFEQEAIVEAVRDRHPGGVAGLIDLVTPAESFAAVAALVRDGGRVATSTGAADADELATRGIETTSVWVKAEPEVLARLAEHADAGRIRVSLEQVYPLEAGAEAIAHFRRGSHGKIGVAVG